MHIFQLEDVFVHCFDTAGNATLHFIYTYVFWMNKIFYKDQAQYTSKTPRKYAEQRTIKKIYIPTHSFAQEKKKTLL